jgi:hypothetical protein
MFLSKDVPGVRSNASSGRGLAPKIKEDRHMQRSLWACSWAVAILLGTATFAQPGGRKAAPDIEPQADKALKAMSEYLGHLKTYSFQVEEFYDVVEDDGLKLQFSNQRRLSVHRPNRIYGESEGDSAHSRFYYNGKTVTVVDRKNKTYAVEKVPGTIDAMLEDLHDRFGINPPLVDFLLSDPYKVFTENVQSGTYVGLNYVGKTKCHHLAFRTKLLDWQIWIDAGEKPLPRKLLITFKRQVDQPQFTALIHRWDVNPELKEALFAFPSPEGLRQVDFLKRHGDAPEKAPGGK